MGLMGLAQLLACWHICRTLWILWTTLTRTNVSLFFLITVFLLSSLNDKDSVRAGNGKALEQQLGHLCMIGDIFQNHNSSNQSHLQHIVLIMAVGSSQMETVTKTAHANAARLLLSNIILQKP